MFRNILAATLRNLARNGIYSAISILGLAVGISAAILAGIIIRNEVTYDRFIGGHESVYLALSAQQAPGNPVRYGTATSHLAALGFRTRSEVEAVTRIMAGQLVFQHGQLKAEENFYWADPNVFDVLRLPVVAGDLTGALHRADGIVLTRSMAHKYFGEDAPLGQSLEIDGSHVMTVMAVVEDLPDRATSLQSGVFASGLAANSGLTIVEREPVNPEGLHISLFTYLRLKPDGLASLRTAMPSVLATFFRPRRILGAGYTMELAPIGQVHLDGRLNPSGWSRLTLLAVSGALILFVACVNFINLSTAIAARRSLEVGVRKVSGAGHGALISRFLSESLLIVAVALIIAAMLVEWLLPAVNAFLDTGAVFAFWRDPSLLACVLAGASVVAVVAGAYPAFVLSAFRPAAVLRGWVTHSRTASATRRVLVTMQFAILIGLMIGAGVVYQQRAFAIEDALRIDTDQMLGIRSACDTALKNELRALPGVRGVFCSDDVPTRSFQASIYRSRDGDLVTVGVTAMEFGLLDLYGVRPIAGRLPELQSADVPAADPQPHVLNETAVRRLGFASPETAVGQMLASPNGMTYEIVGVVPDFSLMSVEEPIGPHAYIVAPASPRYRLINVKLSGQDIPETLTEIDRLWTATGNAEPIRRFFLEEYVQGLYVSVLRQGQAFGIFCMIAVLLACIGLAALASSTTERRTKEIGIRKATGAASGDIMRLLSWEFAKPVLWANLIAWPVAWWTMQRWLNGFARHIDLDPRIFLGAGAAALLLALVTVAAHSWWVARAKPVAALRYE